ncbi:hypothetical protein [uncultured Mucilaginibacter sp.]|uniref:hypothetical protein n=1 Tax=uncultured Mucilaginibacter sp. TaxID=797541 RepID=UPI0025F85E95|nr:hypothetical protein [uncultured Mucilaginibacter sp.]
MNKPYTKLSVLTIAIALFTTGVKAQQGVNISSDGYGFGVIGKVNNEIKGTPNLYDDWVEGTAVLADGTVYKDMDLIYDVMDNMLIFKSDKGTPLAFAKPVKEFTLNFSFNGNVHSRTFRNGFTAIDGATSTTFYEVLSDGNVKLLKKIQKKVAEERTGGSILASKVINNLNTYYLSRNQELVKIKKDKKSILAALNDKADLIESYTDKNKLNFREEDGLVRIVNYYNRAK